jgi:hypothetical protein
VIDRVGDRDHATHLGELEVGGGHELDCHVPPTIAGVEGVVAEHADRLEPIRDQPSSRWLEHVEPILAGNSRAPKHTDLASRSKAMGMRALIAMSVLVASADARAECPTTPDDPVCRPWSAVLLPTAYAGVYAPQSGPTFVGGGVEAIWLAWSDNSAAFGPSQGRIRSSVGVYSGDDATLVMWRTGAQVGFERNASRQYLIPYFAVDFGGFYTEGTGRRWFVDGGLGLYLVHRRGVILDAEVTGLLPFQHADDLGGFTSRLALSFALW